MASLWQEWKEKIGDRLHSAVDRALEESSVALYDQSLRDMEAYIDLIEEAAVGMKAAAEGNERHLTQYQAEVKILDTRLNQLLAEDQAEEAGRVQQALNIKQGQISETQAQIERQEAQHAGLAHNWETLKRRLQVLQGERGSVVALVALARAEQAIGSIERTLGGLTSLGADSEIGAMAGHIWQRLDEAEARLGLVDVDEVVAQAAAAIEAEQVEEQLTERRRRLGLVIEEGEASAVPPAPEAEAPSKEEPAAETEKAPGDVQAVVTPTQPEPEASDTMPEPPQVPES